MSREGAIYQSLASCGAAVIAFIGVCHEFAGQFLFPWGPSLFGGALGWHTVGLLFVILGLVMLGATVRLIEFPVVPVATLLSVIGIAVGVFAAMVHHQFHLFAFATAVAGVTTAFYHRKAIAHA